MEVGIRELRSNLAAILDAVDRGETVTITRHGRPRARIQPVVETAAEIIARGTREGWIEPAATPRLARSERRPPAYRRAGAAASPLDALLEERAEDR